MVKRLNMDDPNAFGQEVTLDSRWTESKLIAAGYEWKRDGPCKTCGDQVSFYKREKAEDYKGTARWLVLNETVLDPHLCKGR